MSACDQKTLASAARKGLGVAVVLAGLALSFGAAQAATLPDEAKAVLALRDTAGPKRASDPKIAAPGGFRLLMVGEKTPEQKSLSNVLFDGGGMKRVFAGLIQVNPGSSLSLQNCRMVDAPRGYIIDLGASLSLDHCYLNKMGMLSQPGDHLEQIFVHSGKVSYTNSLFDVTGSPTPPNTVTAVVFFKSTDGEIDATIDHCVFIGITSLHANYSIQAGSAGNDLKLTISNSGLQRGTSGYVGITEIKGRVTLVDGGGNYDIDTGRPIKVN